MGYDRRLRESCVPFTTAIDNTIDCLLMARLCMVLEPRIRELFAILSTNGLQYPARPFTAARPMVRITSQSCSRRRIGNKRPFMCPVQVSWASLPMRRRDAGIITKTQEPPRTSTTRGDTRTAMFFVLISETGSFATSTSIEGGHSDYPLRLPMYHTARSSEL